MIEIELKNIIRFTILFVIFTIGYTLVINQGLLPEFFYIDSTDRDIESLVNTIWGIQVTLSVVSISLISIIVGKMDRKLYGLKISDILAINRKKIFLLTYFECIGAVILLASLNIIPVIHVVLPMAMLNFFMNLFLLGYILFKTYDVLTNEEKYIELSREYLQLELHLKIENNSSRFTELLKNILVDTQFAIYTNNILVIEQNLECLLEFIKQILDVEVTDSEIEETRIVAYKEVLDVYEELMKYLLERGFHKVYIRVIKNFLNLEQRHQILIRNFIEDQVDNLSEFCHQSLNEGEYKEVIEFLSCDLINEKDIDNVISSKDMSYYLIKSYCGLYRRLEQSSRQNEILNNFYSSMMIYEIDKRDDYITKVKYRTLLSIFKLLLDFQDVKTFNILFQKLYKCNSFSMKQGKFDNLQVYLILMQLNIYCYYAISKEEYFTDETKYKIKSFLLAVDDNKTKESFNLSSFIQKIDYRCWCQYDTLSKSLSNWEYMPHGEAKWMCMDSAIFEFYFLYTICFVEQYEFEKVYTTLEDKTLMLNMLNFYNIVGELNQQIEEQLKMFKEIYLQNKLSSNDNREILYDFLCDKKIAQEISQEKAYTSDENMEVYRNELIRKFSEGLKKNETIYKINSDMKLSTTSFHSSIFVLNSVLAKNIPLIGRTFESSMIGRLHNFIIHHLKDNLIEYTINYSQVNKIHNLLQYFKQNNINPNLRLNSSLLKDWLFKSNELEEDISLFNNFEANLHTIDKYVNQRYRYYLEVKDDSIQINIKEIIIRNLTEGELNIEIKNYLEDDMYCVPFGNNLKLVFNESQIKEYIQNKYQVFEVKLDLYIPDTIKGVVVNVKYDR